MVNIVDGNNGSPKFMSAPIGAYTKDSSSIDVLDLKVGRNFISFFLLH